MTFSIRSFLVVIAILAAWLGALVAKSLLAVELVSNLTTLLVVLTLAFAIWDKRPEQRAFWTGFFVLGIANLALGHQFSAYQQTSDQVATVILGEPQPAKFTTPVALPMYAPPTGFTAGGGGAFYSVSTAFNASGTPAEYFVQHQAIGAAVPALLSLVVGCVGGYLTLWIWRQKAEPESSRTGTPVPPSA